MFKFVVLWGSLLCPADLSIATDNPCRRPNNKRDNREINATVLLLRFFPFLYKTVTCSVHKEGSKNKELSAVGGFTDFLLSSYCFHTVLINIVSWIHVKYVLYRVGKFRRPWFWKQKSDSFFPQTKSLLWLGSTWNSHGYNHQYKRLTKYLVLFHLFL